MQQNRATIEEIRTSLGGDCPWVTRRMLRQAGVPFPTRDQIAEWADNPPDWATQARARRTQRQAAALSQPGLRPARPGTVTITCPGCGLSIKVRTSKARARKNWEGLYCGRRSCGFEPPDAEGMVTVIGVQAVGSFVGWRHEFPSDATIASLTRARDLAAAVFAVQPGSPVQATIKALVAPVGPGHHLVTLSNGYSTGIVADNGMIEIENPMVVAALHRMVHDGDDIGVIMRTFTAEVSHTLPNGMEIPVRELRAWHLEAGVFHPLTEQQVFAIHCTDAETGEPIPPERGVRFLNAHPIGG